MGLSVCLRLAWLVAAAAAVYSQYEGPQEPDEPCQDVTAEFNRLTEPLPAGRLPRADLQLMTAGTDNENWCRNMCQARPSCRSVAFSRGAAECRLFQVPATLDNTEAADGDWLLVNRMSQGQSALGPGPYPTLHQSALAPVPTRPCISPLWPYPALHQSALAPGPTRPCISPLWTLA
ncbi:hypothetical protein FJT64_013599 [Amphibalanus amphitrite]|uniref:Apple domain-containing protein n=1 Tax=Amphibalanus amphitrite TaxID=1232801 RepID=A0A6A4VC56_AMPAM|nr:hypothetical protein FJT64_013599 [Amphibalanus amphitrite]